MEIIAQAGTTDLTWLWTLLLAVGGIGFIVAGLGLSGKLPNWNPKTSLPSDHPSKEQSSTPQSSDKKFCPQCGTANPLGAGFCVNCGVQFPSN